MARSSEASWCIFHLLLHQAPRQYCVLPPSETAVDHINDDEAQPLGNGTLEPGYEQTGKVNQDLHHSTSTSNRPIMLCRIVFGI
jgi:hypothetical protein